MKLEQVVASLQAIKGAGKWRAVAGHAGIHYDTLARIARSDIEHPSVTTVERIAAALEALDCEPAKA